MLHLWVDRVVALVTDQITVMSQSMSQILFNFIFSRQIKYYILLNHLCLPLIRLSLHTQLGYHFTLGGSSIEMLPICWVVSSSSIMYLRSKCKERIYLKKKLETHPMSLPGEN